MSSSSLDRIATTTRITSPRDVLGQDAELVWHKDTSLGGADVVILPGGFAHGDYLRTGAIASFSPIMQEVTRFAAAGGPVLGICNGFQVLLEAGLLPGAMLQESHPEVSLRVSACESRADRHAVHACLPARSDPEASDRAWRRELLRRARGHRTAGTESSGHLSLRLARRATSPTRRIRTARVNNIAGICNERRNVVGLMPHPERACELAIGSADGLVVFESILKWGRESFVEDTLRLAPDSRLSSTNDSRSHYRFGTSAPRRDAGGVRPDCHDARARRRT